MHSTMKLINKPKVHYCRKCVVEAYKKSTENVEDFCEDLCVEITRTRTLEDDTLVKLHKLTSILEESNNLIS